MKAPDVRQHPREQSPEVRPERRSAEKHRLCHGCLQRARNPGREAPRFVGIQRQNSAVIRADDRSVQPLLQRRRAGDGRQLSTLGLILPADGAAKRRADAFGELLLDQVRRRRRDTVHHLFRLRAREQVRMISDKCAERAVVGSTTV